MSIAPSVLFSFAALAAILTIWKNIVAALPAIRGLRAELSDDGDIHVTTLETRSLAPNSAEARSPRSRRHQHPKPITHRLHHFPHPARAA
ncbi:MULTISPECIES: hypothetical protein [unclassified Novosphingobium]|uniref:hypothetical protein n=1 Tax=unclassified Novosphingobium TaxID=2644732 RepID=UPI0013567991|nr:MULTISPECIES: hypothetical protein [unclassified Novosphingobium]